MNLRYIILATAALVAFTNTAQSQTAADTVVSKPISVVVENSTDTTIVNVSGLGKVIVIERDQNGKTRQIITFKRERKNRIFSYNILFDIGFNSYSDRNVLTGSDGNDSFLSLNTTKSVNVALYPLAGTLRLTKNRMLELQTGLGIDWANYRFEDSWTIENVNGHTVPSNKYRVDGENTLSKSKLLAVYMNVPLMVKLNIPIGGSYRKGFYLSAGVIGGLKLGSHSKVKYSNGGSKEKDNDSFNLNLLRYDLTLRAGYRGIGVYLNYQMSPMFESDKGPKLFPYAAGLSVTL